MAPRTKYVPVTFVDDAKLPVLLHPITYKKEKKTCYTSKIKKVFLERQMYLSRLLKTALHVAPRSENLQEKKNTCYLLNIKKVLLEREIYLSRLKTALIACPINLQEEKTHVLPNNY